MSEVRENIARSISLAIEQSGFRKSEVADQLQVSRAAVSNWTKGDNAPDIEILVKMSALFGLPLSTIIGAGDGFLVSPQEHTLLNLFRKLNKEGRRKLIEDAQDYADLRRYSPSGDPL